MEDLHLQVSFNIVGGMMQNAKSTLVYIMFHKQNIHSIFQINLRMKASVKLFNPDLDFKVYGSFQFYRRRHLNRRISLKNISNQDIHSPFFFIPKPSEIKYICKLFKYKRIYIVEEKLNILLASVAKIITTVFSIIELLAWFSFCGSLC